MEDSNKGWPSCIMLAVNLISPVSLSSVFDSGDLKDSGFEFDSHITILYSHDYLDKDYVMSDIQDIQELKDREFNINTFLESQRKSDPKPVTDLFGLSNFSNDSDYIILRLKPGSGIYDVLSIINSALSKKYGVESDFGTYKPHLTLAELKKGTSEKYLNSETLKAILRDSLVKFEDIIFSYDLDDKNYKVYDLTQFQSVPRYFRIYNEKELYKELNK